MTFEELNNCMCEDTLYVAIYDNGYTYGSYILKNDAFEKIYIPGGVIDSLEALAYMIDGNNHEPIFERDRKKVLPYIYMFRRIIVCSNAEFKIINCYKLR